MSIHLALIFDEERLSREQLMLHRLCVGLIGEGIRVTRIVPSEMHEAYIAQGERRIALAPRLETELKVLPWQRKQRMAILAASLEKNTPDFIHAVGRESWDVARDMAEFFDRQWSLDVWSTAVLKAIPVGRKAERVAAYIAPTPSLARQLRMAVAPDLISVVPMGVTCADETPPRKSDSDLARFIAVVGSGQDLKTYRAILRALGELCARHENLRLILELSGPRQHEIWREARRHKLLGRTSTLRTASPNRSLLTSCDVLVLPDALGEASSLPLEAMARGSTIVATRDPIRDDLRNDETAMIVDPEESPDWSGILERAVYDDATRDPLRRRAHRHVIEHHGLSMQLAAFEDLINHALTGGTMSFSEATGRSA